MERASLETPLGWPEPTSCHGGGSYAGMARYEFDDGKVVYRVLRRQPKPERIVQLAVGTMCRVVPVHPAKLKNRGRVCEIKSFPKDLSQAWACVRYEDSGKIARALIPDLVPLEHPDAGGMHQCAAKDDPAFSHVTGRGD